MLGKDIDWWRRATAEVAPSDIGAFATIRSNLWIGLEIEARTDEKAASGPPRRRVAIG
jgi:hypothetical protein